MQAAPFETHRHGCFNRSEFAGSYQAQNGYWPMSKPEAGTRLPRVVQVPNVMTRDCQYTQHQPQDERCAGCCHQKKEAA